MKLLGCELYSVPTLIEEFALSERAAGGKIVLPRDPTTGADFGVSEARKVA